MLENDALRPPQFSPFTCAITPADAADCAAWGALNAHDPSLIEADGAFYAFSTGNNGQDRYQIRRSPDLVRWEYVGQAFPGAAALERVSARLRSVYGKPFENTTLWAPDVVPAPGGGYWLYGCYTAEFGSNYSVLFLAYAPQICGPYTVSGELVVSGGNWGGTPNAIDPQIVCDAHGRMFMTYGSFFGGIRLLELDAASGLRKDGFTFEDFRTGKISARQYYGERLLGADDAEGSVAAFSENVPVYPRFPFGAAVPAPQYKNFYYLMASRGSLFRDYNMRVWRSESLGGFEGAGYGRAGKKLSSSCTWRHSPAEAGSDFFAPGHNDIFETSDGRELLVCHNRTVFGVNWPHYLFVFLLARNADGDLVFSLNRYAGERLRPVGREEIAGKTFDYIPLTARNGEPVFARRGLRLEADGSAALGGEVAGRWRLFGKNFVDLELEGQLYRGAAMPAYIERAGRFGITVSLLGKFPLFLNESR